MNLFGIDAHKRTHTAVGIDDVGRQLGCKTTTSTTSADNLALLKWAERFGSHRVWAIEDCRHLSRRLEADLLRAGEHVVRVPPKLMANTRTSARTFGKSDPIDALAVARAALAHPDLPTARLDGPERELRLLIDHREALVAERTRHINRLRWRLHELDPSWNPPGRVFDRFCWLDQAAERLAKFDCVVAELALDDVERIRALTVTEHELHRRITRLIAPLAPALLALFGCGALTAAKIVAETADITRFKSKDAYARHNGTAPIPVWSGNNDHFRLSRNGNRQLNAAIHRIAVTQATRFPDAVAYLAKRTAAGKPHTGNIRALKRKLSDVVYYALLASTGTHTINASPLAA
jgi:transposase